tara:strand:- start:1204 stop:1407 length:204 start_codon:yes stop_codon:yes gene_type:complete
MIQENNFPFIPKELLEALEERFPRQDFGPGESLRELDYHYGQRSVIRFLQNKTEEQMENSLTNIPDI